MIRRYLTIKPSGAELHFLQSSCGKRKVPRFVGESVTIRPATACSAATDAYADSTAPAIVGSANAKIVGPAPLKQAPTAPASRAASVIGVKWGKSRERYGSCNRSCIPAAIATRFLVSNPTERPAAVPTLKAASGSGTFAGS